MRFFLVFCLGVSFSVNADTADSDFAMRTVTTGLSFPHDIVCAPDQHIWLTERTAGTVSFIEPSSGLKTLVLTLGGKMVQTSSQDGLLGLALHPSFFAGKPYVYIAYSYSQNGNDRLFRIERYSYDFNAKVLQNPEVVMENLPGSYEHNGGRLAVGFDSKLYYSVGDMGAGQFNNIARANNAQCLAGCSIGSPYEGKVLRFNLEPISGSWIPTNNPFGVNNPIYTLGHRNPQGLVWGNVSGKYKLLFSSEHGPYSDDEVNILKKGANYGWPLVAGFCDGNYDGRTLGGSLVASETANCKAFMLTKPLLALYPFGNPPNDSTSYLTWPTIAPSGMDFYNYPQIPGWGNSLLIASLKGGFILRLGLSASGQAVVASEYLFKGQARFRDVCVASDGKTLYAATDSTGAILAASGSATKNLPPNAGSLLEFVYDGDD